MMAFGAVFALIALRMIQVVLTGTGHALRKQVVEVSAGKGALDAIPFTFDVPSDLPGTDLL
ncbi:MAG TPA: hypothetical protein VE685_09685 [Thermoanaerobaculia bacterium]|nr:hypothetical protein [Thermoanaerobaculia bacterium]